MLIVGLSMCLNCLCERQLFIYYRIHALISHVKRALGFVYCNLTSTAHKRMECVCTWQIDFPSRILRELHASDLLTPARRWLQTIYPSSELMFLGWFISSLTVCRAA
jgi:hypothetical protein